MFLKFLWHTRWKFLFKSEDVLCWEVWLTAIPSPFPVSYHSFTHTLHLKRVERSTYCTLGRIRPRIAFCFVMLFRPRQESSKPFSHLPCRLPEALHSWYHLRVKSMMIKGFVLHRRDLIPGFLFQDWCSVEVIFSLSLLFLFFFI